MANRKNKLKNVKGFDDKKVSIVSSDTEYLLPYWFKDVNDYYDEYVSFILKNDEMWDSDSNIDPVNTGDDTGLGNNLNVKKTFCYICNVQVPLPYINQHLKSSKHMMYRKIAEVGMERTQKQMAQNYYVDKQPSSIYFCLTCITMVADTDKEKHLKSRTHRNAALIDTMLEDFLKLYTDSETEINDETGSEQERVRIQTEFVDDTNNNNEKYGNCNPRNFEGIKTAAEGNEDIHVADLKDIKNLNHRLEYLDRFYLKIITEDNVFFKVKNDNYFGLSDVSSQHTLCKLCMMIVKDKKTHLLTPQHMKWIVLPLDKECIRKLDDTRYHCVLCNELIEDHIVHGLCSVTHKTLRMNALFYEGNDKEDDIEDVETRLEGSESQMYRCNQTGAIPKTIAPKKVLQFNYGETRKDSKKEDKQK